MLARNTPLIRIEEKYIRRCMISIPILKKEDVVDGEDPINMESSLNKSIADDDKMIEEENGLLERSENNGGHKKDIRDKVIDFMRKEGYFHTEGETDFDDETNDLFSNDSTLIDVTITTGIDNKVIMQVIGGDKIRIL